ncbi:Hypothetical_protein [Hexamita inflata]|uniref:Hypothetical_protein n=1 Tax=Hexamita inflata TaxID=28002 RepID=A0AA86PKE1_9EUKA|nr:Hypothetical protein HINF_LOCUS27748 [Hexamita inflata]
MHYFFVQLVLKSSKQFVDKVRLNYNVFLHLLNIWVLVASEQIRDSFGYWSRLNILRQQVYFIDILAQILKQLLVPQRRLRKRAYDPAEVFGQRNVNSRSNAVPRGVVLQYICMLAGYLLLFFNLIRCEHAIFTVCLQFQNAKYLVEDLRIPEDRFGYRGHVQHEDVADGLVVFVLLVEQNGDHSGEHALLREVLHDRPGPQDLVFEPVLLEDQQQVVVLDHLAVVIVGYCSEHSGCGNIFKLQNRPSLDGAQNILTSHLLTFQRRQRALALRVLALQQLRVPVVVQDASGGVVQVPGEGLSALQLVQKEEKLVDHVSSGQQVEVGVQPQGVSDGLAGALSGVGHHLAFYQGEVVQLERNFELFSQIPKVLNDFKELNSGQSLPGRLVLGQQRVYLFRSSRRQTLTKLAAALETVLALQLERVSDAVEQVVVVQEHLLSSWYVGGRHNYDHVSYEEPSRVREARVVELGRFERDALNAALGAICERVLQARVHAEAVIVQLVLDRSADELIDEQCTVFQMNF